MAFDFTGPVTIHVDGPSLDEIRRAVRRELQPLEHRMTTINEALAALSAKTDANSAALNDLVSDVRALIASLSNVDLPADAQAQVDAITAKLDEDASTMGALDAEVGDADGSDTPPAEPTA